MKLRTKFALLISGIFVIPVAITITIGSIYLAFSVTGSELSRIMSIGHWLRQQYPHFFRLSQKNDIIPSTPPPEGLDLLMINEDGVVTYSTFPDYAWGSSQNAGRLVGQFHAENKNSLVMSEFFIDEKSGHAYTAIFAIDRGTADFLVPDKRTLVFPLVLIILIVCSAVIGVIVMSTLGRSIIRLESATKHIVAGNLDFKLEARGNDEIASLTRSFDSMREKLKEEYGKRARFLMAVSHDLATPLTSIEGYTEAMLDGFAKEETTRTKYLSVILDKSRVLDARIAELIEFVRMETGDWKMKCAPSDIREFLLSTASMYREDALVFKRAFESEISVPDSILVNMDKSLLMRALENLFHNAVRYSTEADIISLRATFTEKNGEGEIIVTIADTGTGIPETEIGHIFEPFFRGKRFSKEKGFGIGLSTVRSIIEAHGWTIEVSSEQGKGSAFRIRIPAGKGNLIREAGA